MRHIFTLLTVLLLSSTSLLGQVVWDNFQDIRIADYGFINGTFIPYVENPDATGDNTSTTVAEYSRNPAELFDVIIADALMADLSDYKSGAKSMSVKVWSPKVGVTVQITLEDSNTAMPANYPTGRYGVFLATTSVASAWETLTFTFDNTPDPNVGNTSVNRLVLLFDPNTNNGDTYYFDDLMGPELANPPCTGAGDPLILNDFECNQAISYTFSHSGPNFRRVMNPDPSGANTSSHVATYTRNGGEEFDVIIGQTDGNMDFSVANQIHLHVWDAMAPTDVVLSLQFNPFDGSAATEVKAIQATTSTASTWEDLVFDASDVTSSNVNQLVLLFNPGNFVSQQVYWDNLRLEGSVGINDLRADHSFFELAPTRTNGSTHLLFSEVAREDRELTVVDAMGKLVAQDNVSGSTLDYQLNTQGLASGLYFVKIKEGDRFGTQKMIVMD